MASKRFCGFVPEEVIEQILARIPCTKSILRCTLVCKSWNFLIKSSRFIDNMYLYRPNSTKYLLCYTNCADARDFDYSLYSDSEPSKNPVKLMFPHGLKYVKVHGCCNGVICYTKSGEKQGNICLWNPIARKLKILPKFRKFDYDTSLKEAIGFWYDKEKSDYVVVKITCIFRSVTSSVDVYSLRSNSWKTISDNCPGIVSRREHNLVYAKGTLHWLQSREFGPVWRFVSLDMNNAKFREAKISSKFEYDTLCLKEVDSNSFVILRRKDLDHVCVVKVHEENLELLYNDSGRSLHNDSSLLGYMVGYRNNGEALLRLPAGDTIVSYDFSSKQLTDFVLSFKNINFWSAYPFVETLVLLNDGDGQYYTNSSQDKYEDKRGRR